MNILSYLRKYRDSYPPYLEHANFKIYERVLGRHNNVVEYHSLDSYHYENISSSYNANFTLRYFDRCFECKGIVIPKEKLDEDDSYLVLKYGKILLEDIL